MQSMTGFGRAVGQTDLGSITVEIKAVNNRYLDVTLRLPRDLSFLDDTVKALVREHASRGRVEVQVRLQADKTTTEAVQLNLEQIRSYMQALGSLQQELGLQCEIKLEHLLALPGVFVDAPVEVDEGVLSQQVKKVVAEALTALKESRRKEGERLAEDMAHRISVIAEVAQRISSLQDEVVLHYRQRLKDNIERIMPDVQVDSGRLEMEVAIFADRVSIAEELVRLQTHLDNFKGFLSSREAVGRKMDFYLQELNREVNTIGSKVPDALISQQVVEIKAELEKIREQAQNIE